MDCENQPVEAPFPRHQKTVLTPAEIVLVEYLLSQRNEETTYPEQLLRYLIYLIANEEQPADIRKTANEIRVELNDWHIRQLRKALWQSFTQ